MERWTDCNKKLSQRFAPSARSRCRFRCRHEQHLSGRLAALVHVPELEALVASLGQIVESIQLAAVVGAVEADPVNDDAVRPALEAQRLAVLGVCRYGSEVL